MLHSAAGESRRSTKQATHRLQGKRRRGSNPTAADSLSPRFTSASPHIASDPRTQHESTQPGAWTPSRSAANQISTAPPDFPVRSSLLGIPSRDPFGESNGKAPAPASRPVSGPTSMGSAFVRFPERNRCCPGIDSKSSSTEASARRRLYGSPIAADRADDRADPSDRAPMARHPPTHPGRAVAGRGFMGSHAAGQRRRDGSPGYSGCEGRTAG
jgi:hypothetical protein